MYGVSDEPTQENKLIQSEVSECGLACLAIAADKFGSQVSMMNLRRKFPVSSRGLTMREVKDIAAEMGMIGRAVSCDVGELVQLKTPAILHWGFQHFVVLAAVKKSKIVINDPIIGKREVSFAEVSSKFTGVALELTAAPEFVKRKQPSDLSLASWFQVMPEMHGALVQVLILAVLLQIYVVASPLYIQLAIDQAALRGDENLLAVLTGGFTLFCIYNALASFLRGAVTVRLTAMLNWNMTVRLFRHLIRLPLPWFQRRRLADILSKVDAIGPVRDLISGTLVTTAVDGVLTLGTLIMMFVLAPKLAAIVLLGLALYVVIRYAFLPITIRRSGAAIMARIEESGKRIETIRAIQTIKVMGGENERESDWANKFSESVLRERQSTFANLTFSTLQAFIDGLIRIALIYVGCLGVIKSELSIGLLYAFLSYQAQFSIKANSLFDQFVKWRTTSLYSHRLADIALTPKETGLEEGGYEHQIMEGAIQISNLSFSYSNTDKPIFTKLNVDIKKGEFVAIVGASGCGKSTLLKVLCGLYPASQGEILIDGRSMKSWGSRQIRRNLGVVMQDDELLSGTIAENVTFFAEHIDQNLMWRCLESAALASDIAAMPLRCETMIGDMGISLSGGQKQRLLLARALYRKPQILILDEATSHLDVQREKIINESLKLLNITRIVVAHRKETIMAADRIICLEDGHISYDVGGSNQEVQFIP